MHHNFKFHNSLKCKLFLLITGLNISFCLQAKNLNPSPSDTLQALPDSVLTTNDSLTVSVPRENPNKIDAEIIYSASDSIVFYGNGTGFLHGKGDVKYKNITLQADFIRVKMDSSLIYARGTTDSLGNKIGEPVFSEGEATYYSKELTYNLQSKKGYIRNAVTQQGEGYVISDKTKKLDDNILLIADGKYTTCDKHDNPDFYLYLTKGKIKPGDYIVTGPAYLVLADVPLPIAVPFGFFPFTDKYSSGILMPNYADELNRGFGLTNGGYYFALSDYADLELLGDIYTKGTWALTANSRYIKKYKYNGNFSFSYRVDVTGEKDLPDYSKATNMNIRWTHSQDQKANPYFTFTSSVNFSTSGYNRSNINSYFNPNLNSENTKGSSISFTKRFPSQSNLSLSGSMLINQRTKDSTISLTLPTLNIAVSRFSPFKRKNTVGNERWYEKIYMSYSGTFANSIDTKESLLLSSSLSKDWRNGMRHSIPVSATFNLFKYINISPSFNYTERWYLQSVDKHWDSDKQKEITDTVSGFNRVYDFNMGVSASTKLYGFFIPIRSIFGDKIDRIRHVFTPTIGFGYAPDFGDPRWGYYDSYKKTTKDPSNPASMIEEEVVYSHYQGSLYGYPGSGKSGNINFSFANNIEMKLRNDNDTTGKAPFKKVSLIDNFSVSGGYNLAADSMQWSNFSTNLRIKFSDKYSLNLSGAFDPYMYGLNQYGNPVRINKLRWNYHKFPKFLGTNASYSLALNNDTFKKLFSRGDNKKTDVKNNASSKENSDNLDDEGIMTSPEINQLGLSEKSNQEIQTDADGYQKVTIPWNINISYSVRYANTNVFDKEKMEYKMGFTHNLSFSGDISLTPKWRISSSTSYDFVAKQFTYTSVNVSRDLHCWNMSASFVPFGPFQSYYFRIGVNSSMLRDLKYEKRSGYGSTPITWY